MTLSDRELLQRARTLAKAYRRIASDLVAVLAEIDRRSLFVSAGCGSLFEYCLRDLQLSEDDAFKLIRAARASRARPEVLSYIAEGSLTVRAVALLAPEKTKPDFVELLDRAKGKTIREVERMVAERRPEEPPKESVRLLASAPPAAGDDPDLFSVQAPPPAPKPPRYQVEFSIDEPLMKDVETARSLLSHVVPDGKWESLLRVLVEDYLTRHDPARRAIKRRATRNPKARRVPPSVRDAVWKRDGGRCAFVHEGRRCGATRFLELDHVVPWWRGGRGDDPNNVRLLCRAHNQHEARRVLGSIGPAQ